MEFRDYYKTLGVAKTASAKEIKQAFRRLARKHHPDVNPGDRAAEATFKEVNEAYEVLGNPETRKKYDELGANWRQYEQAGAAPGAAWGGPGGASYRTMTPEEMEEMFGGGGSPFSDFFNAFFGGQAGAGTRTRGGRGRPRRAEVEYDIALDLEAALGGRVERVTVPGDGRTLEVRIPAGISDGSRLTAGDLNLRVRLKPHPRFERHGRDLTTRVAVPLATAVLGGTVDVTTLAGSRLAMKVPAGTQPNQRLRVKGHGLPAPGAPDDRGDLYVVLDVRIPTTLSAEAREHFEALRTLDEGRS
ncbi:MAG: DnaJ C-terminal domain-containing protein [Vicinamibacterales bacterium]